MSNEEKLKRTLAEKKDAAVRASLFDSWLVDAIGAATTAISGIGAAIYSINTSFFKNATTDGTLTDQWNKRNADRKAAFDNPEMRGSTLTKEIQRIEAEYFNARKAKLDEKELNYVWQKWRTLRAHQKNEALISFAVGSTVALGIVANLISNRHVFKKQEELEARIEENSKADAERAVEAVNTIAALGGAVALGGTAYLLNKKRGELPDPGKFDRTLEALNKQQKQRDLAAALS